MGWCKRPRDEGEYGVWFGRETQGKDGILTEGKRFKGKAEVLLQLDPFLNELTNMYERCTEKGSVWVTFKRSKVGLCQINAMVFKRFAKIEIVPERNGDVYLLPLFGVSAKDQQRFQASYGTVLKAHMHALKKRERKEKKRAAEGDKKQEATKKRVVST
ncbi:hypothetical protein GIB67_036239 [Kingdonia uniflora]|uniref:Signal recognition particle 14 kDa protein n=1 Tax=Kingdonia uniflora TaxID=39325 RepID=A0A7J7NTC9_9MAGN|nr:hypothetical protein GIB67_036239 [Kingdonia uniflora]